MRENVINQHPKYASRFRDILVSFSNCLVNRVSLNMHILLNPPKWGKTRCEYLKINFAASFYQATKSGGWSWTHRSYADAMQAEAIVCQQALLYTSD
jgi:hypothetical protein